MDRPLARLLDVRGVLTTSTSVAFGVSITVLSSVLSSESCATMLERLGENHAEMTSGTLLRRDRRDLLTGVFGGSVCSGGGMFVVSLSRDCGRGIVAGSSSDSAGSCSRAFSCDISVGFSDVSWSVRWV